MLQPIKNLILLGVTIVTAENLLPASNFCGLLPYGFNQSVSKDEFPWIVKLIYNKDFNNCSGTLINKQYVLTTAYCLNPDDRVHLQLVRLKYYYAETIKDCMTATQNEYDCRKDFGVADIIPHPSYVPELGLDDIGLIRLRQPVDYSGFIRPVCLPTVSTIGLLNLTKILLSGLGILESTKRKPFFINVKTALRKFILRKCLEYYPPVKGLVDYEICVHKNKPKRCPGDNGQPLMKSYSNQWVQSAVLTTGVALCIPGFTVRNKVADYLDWIKDQLRP